MSSVDMDGWEDYTRITEETAVYPSGDETEAILYCTLGLSGEVGEVVDVVKKQWRKQGFLYSKDSQFKAKLIDELGDVMWYMAQLMWNAHIDIDDVIKNNVKKLQERKNAGTLKERPAND